MVSLHHKHTQGKRNQEWSDGPEEHSHPVCGHQRLVQYWCSVTWATSQAASTTSLSQKA